MTNEIKRRSPFEGLNLRQIKPPQEQKPEYTPSPEELEAKRQYEKRDNHRVSAWVARELTKPAYKGLAAIPDIPVVLNNLILAGVNKFAGTQVEGLKLPSEHVGDAVDYVTDGMSVSDRHNEDGIVAKGVEFGTSMAGGGLIGKAAKAIAPASQAVQKVSPWLGSTRGGDIGTAAAMGAATQGAEDVGFDPVTSTVIGMGAGIAPSMIGNKLLKGKVKNFNLEAYDAAKAQDLDLPKVSLDQSATSKLARTAGEHSIYAGKKLKEQTYKTNKSFKEAFNRNLDKTTIKKTLDNVELNKKLYQESEGLLTDKDIIMPKDTFQSVQSAKHNLADNSLVSSAKQEQYQRYLGKLSEATMDFKVARNGQDLHGVKVKQLIQQKQQLNNQISKLPHEEWALKEELINVRNAIKKDINSYAELNPEFKNKWEAAETLYGKMERRVEAEKALGIKETTKINKKFNPELITDNYLNAKNDPSFVRAIGGKENLKHFDDIVTAVQSLPDSKVSTLAQNMKIMSTLSGGAPVLIGAISGGASGAMVGAGFKVGVEVLSHLFSRKNTKALDKLAQYARNQTPENAKILKNTYKKELGMSVEKVNESLEQLIKNSRKAKTRLGAEELAKSVGKD